MSGYSLVQLNCNQNSIKKFFNLYTSTPGKDFFYKFAIVCMHSISSLNRVSLIYVTQNPDFMQLSPCLQQSPPAEGNRVVSKGYTNSTQDFEFTVQFWLKAKYHYLFNVITHLFTDMLFFAQQLSLVVEFLRERRNEESCNKILHKCHCLYSSNRHILLFNC